MGGADDSDAFRSVLEEARRGSVLMGGSAPFPRFMTGEETLALGLSSCLTAGVAGVGRIDVDGCLACGGRKGWILNFGTNSLAVADSFEPLSPLEVSVGEG